MKGIHWVFWLLPCHHLFVKGERCSTSPIHFPEPELWLCVCLSYQPEFLLHLQSSPKGTGESGRGRRKIWTQEEWKGVGGLAGDKGYSLFHPGPTASHPGVTALVRSHLLIRRPGGSPCGQGLGERLSWLHGSRGDRVSDGVCKASACLRRVLPAASVCLI